jgi:hypothetical protein
VEKDFHPSVSGKGPRKGERGSKGLATSKIEGQILRSDQLFCCFVFFLKGVIFRIFPATVRDSPWYTVPSRLCTIWFRRPIQSLARLPLLVMRVKMDGYASKYVDEYYV